MSLFIFNIFVEWKKTYVRAYAPFSILRNTTLKTLNSFKCFLKWNALKAKKKINLANQKKMYLIVH